MRLPLPNIRYGTEQYPESIARSLRVVNIVIWVLTAFGAGFALVQYLDPTPGLWRAATVNLVTFLCAPLVLLLHRFGPYAAPAGIFVVSLWEIVGLTVALGTASGLPFYLILLGALPITSIASHRIALTFACTIICAGTAVALQIFVPVNTGVFPPARMITNAFVPAMVGSFSLQMLVNLFATRQIERAEAAAQRENARSESLLANILPQRIAAELKENADREIAESHPEASILFADMAGFTASASDTEPRELVRFLNRVFVRLDELVEQHGLEKVKTTGDAYMVVSGVPEARADHAQALALLALDIRAALAGLVDAKGRAIGVRIGIASGPVVAGIVGRKKFFYDVWGDAVNTASRMESTSEAGRIQVDAATFARLQSEFDLEARGTIEVRGKGPMRTWYLIGRKPG